MNRPHRLLDDVTMERLDDMRPSLERDGPTGARLGKGSGGTVEPAGRLRLPVRVLSAVASPQAGAAP